MSYKIKNKVDGKFMSVQTFNGIVQGTNSVKTKAILDPNDDNIIYGVQFKTGDESVQIDLMCNELRQSINLLNHEMTVDGKTQIFTIENAKGCPIF